MPCLASWRLPRARGDRPLRAPSTAPTPGLPRARGDRPGAEGSWAAGRAPPRARGSTHRAIMRAPRGSPAHAGIDPGRMADATARVIVAPPRARGSTFADGCNPRAGPAPPRARGSTPRASTTSRLAAPPRARGSTLAPPFAVVRGFPARAGIDPCRRGSHSLLHGSPARAGIDPWRLGSHSLLDVSPARAGIDPSPASRRAGSAPRARGDRPVRSTPVEPCEAPRARGDRPDLERLW